MVSTGGEAPIIGIAFSARQIPSALCSAMDLLSLVEGVHGQLLPTVSEAQLRRMQSGKSLL
jgi:hypothetical protein